MIAALAVWSTATKLPDLLVAAIMAGLFLNSSIQILRHAVGYVTEPAALPCRPYVPTAVSECAGKLAHAARCMFHP
jgi:hypothetical protein